MTGNSRRIRIGDWLVDYDDATRDIELERTIKDVLTAIPGDDQNCMNSRCIMAQRREKVFPHPVYLVSTIKSRVYIVDKLTDAGDPAHAIRYQLSKRDSRLIGEHDALGVGEPGTLRLQIPAEPKGTSHLTAVEATLGYKPSGKGSKTYSGKSKRPITSVGAKGRYMVAVGALTN